MDQRKKAGIMLIIFALTVAGIAAASAAKGRKTEEPPQVENVYHDVPDGEMEEVSESKSDAYMAYSGSSNIEDYWNDCESDLEDFMEEKDDRPDSGRVSSEDLFGRDDPSPAPARSSTGGGGSSAPHRETAKEREARHQKHREEAIELASDIQRRQMGGEDVPDGDGTPLPDIIETIDIPSSTVRRSDVISSLDDGWNETGVSSLDEQSQAYTSEDSHPFKCMFVREEKIKDGQRVSVRLMEDMVVGGVLVPKNSHLMASCSLGGRLELEIANIEMQGRILSLGYEAYDTDGTRGIYCPDAGGAAKTAASRGTSLAGTALRSRVGRVAGDVLTTGISLIESAGGERTVSVPAGYTFYIVKKKTP